MEVLDEARIQQLFALEEKIGGNAVLGREFLEDRFAHVGTLLSRDDKEAAPRQLVYDTKGEVLCTLLDC